MQALACPDDGQSCFQPRSTIALSGGKLETKDSISTTHEDLITNDHGCCPTGEMNTRPFPGIFTQVPFRNNFKLACIDLHDLQETPLFQYHQLTPQSCDG